MRQRSGFRTLASIALGVLAVVLLLGGMALVFAAPLAEMLAVRTLNQRGLGPAQLDITRLGLDGMSVRDVSALDGAVTLAEADVNFAWRDLMQQRKIDSVRVDGLNAKLTWAEDGTIKVGSMQLYPGVDQTPSAPPPAEAAQEPVAETPPADGDQRPQALTVQAMVIGNSNIILALPSGEITTSINATLAQDDATGRALDLTLTSTGAGVTSNVAVSAVEPKDKPAQGSANIVYKVANLALPTMANNINGEANLALVFDANGARTEDSRADLTFSLAQPPAAGPLAALGLDPARPIRLELAATNSRLLKFNLDRTGPSPKATFDAGINITTGTAELRAELKGWSEVPLGGAIPQDFAFERLNVSAKGLRVMGGTADATLGLLDFKGPIAVAAGRTVGQVKVNNLPNAARIEANLASDVRLDGSGFSFDLTDGWVETENLNLGAVTASGISRVALATKSATQTSLQQINLVFGDGTTLAVDLALAGSVPRILMGAPQADGKTGDVATLNLPRMTVSGYLSQKPDETMAGSLKLITSGGLLTHPFVHLGEIDADLNLDGKSLSGPVTWVLLEAPDPTRPKGLDRRGAQFKSNLKFDSNTIDFKGTIVSQKQVEVGTYSYAQSGTKPATITLAIPARTWTSEPSFMDVFGPVAGLTNSSGTFGMDLRATATKEGFAGAVNMAFADFGFTSGTMSMKGLNAVLALDQVWPPRATAPQRIAFGQLVAGVPFTNGDFTIGLAGDGMATISEANMRLAGGSVTGREITLPLDGSSQNFAMSVANVDLETLVKAFTTDGLSATGKLSGRLPMRLSNSRLFIQKGQLVGRDGTIIYKPTTAPAALAQGGGTILMDALANFKFDEVTANLDGDVTKDLAVGLTLKGKNPDLYGGYPIEFNLSLDGPLNQLVREGLSGYRIPEDIKERLQQQGIGAQN